MSCMETYRKQSGPSCTAGVCVSGGLLDRSKCHWQLRCTSGGRADVRLH